MRALIKSLLAAVLLTLPLASGAEEPPARNPDYAHALPDLRTARWLLALQSGDPDTRTNEDEAIRNIDIAIRAIEMYEFDDHKNVADHEQIDMARDHATRLRQALDLLHRAHAYISKEVADTMGVRVRNRALEYIDRAVLAVGHALEAQ